MSFTSRVCSLAVAIAIGPTEATAQSPPSFTPLAGGGGCLIADGTPVESAGLSDCGRVPAIHEPSDLAVSPDDRHVYVTTLTGAVVSFSRDPASGALTFVSCVSDGGDDGRQGTDGRCTDGDALAGAAAVALSPDGRFAYVVSAYSDGIAWLERDPQSGTLSPRACLKDLPRARCGASFGLLDPTAVAVSPDGRHVYVAAKGMGAITAFARDPATGALTPGACVSDSGSDGACENVNALAGVSEIVVSADGGSVYAVAQGRYASQLVTSVDAVTAYARDAGTGALTPRTCLLAAAVPGGSCGVGPGLDGASGIAFAADSAQLIVASTTDSALSVFAGDQLASAGCYRHQPAEGDDREADPEEEDEQDDDERRRLADASGCRPVKALGGVEAVAVSRDGRSVFTTGGSFFAAFRRDPATGALDQFGCLDSVPSYRSCLGTPRPYGYADVETTSDGRSVYVVGRENVLVLSSSVAIVNRSARVSRDGRVGIRLACPSVRALACRGQVGRTPYRVRRGGAATVRVRLAREARTKLHRHGRATVRVAARDADRIVRAAGRVLNVSAR